MPIILKTALEQQIERWQKYGSPLPQNSAMQKIVYPSCARTLTARQDGSPCIDRGQEIVVERCDAFLPLAGDKAGSVGYTENKSPTLRATSSTACVVGIDIYNVATTGNVSKTLNSAATDSDHIPCVVCYDARGNGDGKICPTVTGDHNNRITDYTTVVCQKYVAKDPNAVVYCLQGNGIGRADTAGCGGCGWRENVCYTLNTIDRPAVCYNTIKNEDTTPQYIVRRLTPLECGRLQGMPDWYVADIPHSDANEYKMYGNGMALPNALYIMEGFIPNPTSKTRHFSSVIQKL